ncbi:MAG: nucleotidyltransferase domain-containing protein [Planctomycetes bacterium]|nr:nucleotidyltransferase domain-containing protein [Planctomycetota bacterium]
MIISEEMNTRIQSELDLIELEFGAQILFACESGSRAWGFPSQDSDYDVRMVYHHSQEWYLHLARQRDVIEKPIIDELDVCGWDLNKTLRLLRKSNPNILEWVGSPVVYREHAHFKLLRELLSESFNHRASILHYLNMGLNNKRQWLQRDEIKIKKYLYAIRPLLCAQWVMKHDCQPPMLYHELLGDLHAGTQLQDEVEALVAQKVDMNELDVVPKNHFLNSWIDSCIDEINEEIPEKSDIPSWDPYDAVFKKIVCG